MVYIVNMFFILLVTFIIGLTIYCLIQDYKDWKLVKAGKIRLTWNPEKEDFDREVLDG
jgi:uncharacterized membrane protein YjfL (UPF0719 family)